MNEKILLENTFIIYLRKKSFNLELKENSVTFHTGKILKIKGLKYQKFKLI